MSDITRISVAIPSEVSEIIAAAIANGQYATTSEIVREALRDWSDKHALRKERIEKIRADLLESIADIEAGKGVEAFGYLEQLKAKYSAMKKEKKE